MSFLQAIVIGLIQGVTELFPVSSLGHTVLIPALIGGSWGRLVTQEASASSPYLAFVVGLHVATALALILFFWSEWLRIVRGFVRSLVRRRVETTDERLAWLIVIATIPVGLLGLVLEHQLRVLFAHPVAAASFLTLNGVLLITVERLSRNGRFSRPRRGIVHNLGLSSRPDASLSPTRKGLAALGAVTRAESPASITADSLGSPVRRAGPGAPAQAETVPAPRRVGDLGVSDAVGIGIAQSAALLAGISRDGICMVVGLTRGLTREDAARFAFLLSAPPILAAGVLKIPDLLGPLGAGIRPQILVGSVAAFVAALVAVGFLTRYFRTRSLWPIGCYCVVFGVVCLLRFGLG
ncbi:MAG TPA: undecaprenyl-diphosphate phosphatase [Acidimicrobiales bacterium]|nr:undecaprenyl-diphosphate phosphatase [Acidimicrobiales bacterium]